MYCANVLAMYLINNTLYFCFVDKAINVNKRNIFQEVKEFQKQEYQSRNFQAVMEWLKETIELSNLGYKNKVTANLKIKTEYDAVEIKAKTGHLKCHVYAWERQREK